MKNVNTLDKFHRLTECWSKYNAMKNTYQFGDEAIDMNEFTLLIKDTYDTIIYYKNSWLQNEEFTIHKDILSFYSYLIKVMSHYTPDTCAYDESENFDFTVTCLITDALINYLFIYNGSLDRKIRIYPTDYFLREDCNFNEEFIEYDIDSPELEKIREFAKLNPEMH